MVRSGTTEKVLRVRMSAGSKKRDQRQHEGHSALATRPKATGLSTRTRADTATSRHLVTGGCQAAHRKATPSPPAPASMRSEPIKERSPDGSSNHAAGRTGRGGRYGARPDHRRRDGLGPPPGSGSGAAQAEPSRAEERRVGQAASARRAAAE